MLLAFRGENIRSFRDSFELSLLATRVAERHYVRQVPVSASGSRIDVLPTAVIVGANASGKSNVLKAIDDMRQLVVTTFRRPRPGMRKPFIFDKTTAKAPSTFEVDLVLGGIRHQYGFSLDDERVEREWAYYFPSGRAALIFERTGQSVTFGSTVADRAKGRAASKILREDALYLSTAAAVEFGPLTGIFEWFQDDVELAQEINRPFRKARTYQMLREDRWSGFLGELLRAADLGISGIRPQEIDQDFRDKVLAFVGDLIPNEEAREAIEDFPIDEMMGKYVHRIGSEEFELDEFEESMGTQVWLGLIGDVAKALAKGSVLLGDELDASLHPNLVAQLVRLFQRERTNPRGAQLIFNTHDATLLGDSSTDRLLGRDQIWFTEKDADGSSRLYPLTDLDPRKEEAVARRYLAGRYGATPVLSPPEFEAAADLLPSGQ